MVDFEFVRSNVIRFNRNVQEYLNGRYIKAWCDEIYSMFRFGCSPDDYFRYEFYRKSKFEKDKFITWRRSKKIIKRFNDPEKIEIFNNKVKFNVYFRDFIKREWLEIDTATSDELEYFCKKNSSLIIKPVKGGQGQGIFLWNNEDIMSDNVNLADYNGYIAEQILIQHPVMATLNPTSVNTVRVLTFKGKIIAAALRIGGSGAIVDNLHSNVSAKYSCGFPDPQVLPIIVVDRYLDYFTTIMEDRLWQVLAKPGFRWRNRSGLSMNAAKAA